MISPFEPLLRAQGLVLFDGAMATELELRGADLSGRLWSARLLRDDPWAIVEVHVDSLRAGADVISTASYQASREGFEQAGLSAAEADASLALSVGLARDACQRAGVTRALPPLVAASLGPWGAMLADGSEYRGDYVVPERRLIDFHRRRVDAVLRGGPDLVLFETIPSVAEGAALAAVAASLPEVPFMVSFSATSAAGIARGEPFAEAVRLFSGSANVVAVGVNCAPPSAIVPLLRSVPAPHPLLAASPNRGEQWDAGRRTWTGPAEGTLADWAPRYVAAGARVVGGCCRTRPADLAAARHALGLPPVALRAAAVRD